MLLIPCPYCGEREESEFHQGGEAHIKRPADTDKLTDDEWADYLFLRDNKKGIYLERWVHRHGPTLVQYGPQHDDKRNRCVYEIGANAKKCYNQGFVK